MKQLEFIDIFSELEEFFDDPSFSVKRREFFASQLPRELKASDKRVMEALFAKVRIADIAQLHEDRDRLIVSLTRAEYSAIYGRATSVKAIFFSAAKHFMEFQAIEYIDKTTGEWVKAHVVDHVKITPDGNRLTVVFTDGILPVMAESQKKAMLALNLGEFSRLTGRYAQWFYELFTAFLSLDRDTFTFYQGQHELVSQLKLEELSMKSSHIMQSVIKPALAEINTKTTIVADVTVKKMGARVIGYYYTVARNQDPLPDNIEQRYSDPAEASNTHRKEGVPDAWWYAIYQAKKEKGKPHGQLAMDMYFDKLIQIVDEVEQLTLEDAFRIAYSSGWVINLHRKYFLDELKRGGTGKKGVSDPPAPKELTPEEKEASRKAGEEVLSRLKGVRTGR